MLNNFSGMRVIVIDAQKQARTERDVRGPWVRPRVPSKAKGRKGTRRAWKRRNAPHWVMLYREPDDVLVIGRGMDKRIVTTPLQADALRAQVKPMPLTDRVNSILGYAPSL